MGAIVSIVGGIFCVASTGASIGVGISTGAADFFSGKPISTIPPVDQTYNDCEAKATAAVIVILIILIIVCVVVPVMKFCAPAIMCCAKIGKKNKQKDVYNKAVEAVNIAQTKKVLENRFGGKPLYLLLGTVAEQKRRYDDKMKKMEDDRKAKEEEAKREKLEERQRLDNNIVANKV